jgi:large subunit ribosomal protein L3
MSTVLMVEDKESPFKGQEVAKAVTIVETPSLFAIGFSCYDDSPTGLKKVGEYRAKQLPKEARRVLPVQKKFKEIPEGLKGKSVGVLVITQPWKSGLGKHTPEVLEIPVGGKSFEEALGVAKELLGKEVKVSDVFKEGEVLDVISVTKGKGWQGVVKRFGVALNPHKASKARRHGGSIGPEKQAKVMYTIPRAGQMGFHKRTEANKRIIKLSSNTQEAQQKGGFLNYGLLKGDYIVLEGSIPGPVKRLVRLRRSVEKSAVKKPEVKGISTASAQGD